MIGLADIWIAVLSGVIVGLGVSLAVGLLLPLCANHLRRAAPFARSIIILLTLSAPLLAGLAGAKLVGLSPHAPPFDLISDHCHGPGPTCAIHARAEATPLLTALGAGALGVIVVWIGLTLFDLMSQSGRSLRLLLAATEQQTSDTRTLPSERIIAVSAGLFRPRTFLSRGLTRALNERDVAIVEAHETAHGRRRDGLMRLIAYAFSIGHLPPARTRLLGELELAQEQLCDRAAAKTFGEIETAETLLKVERLKQNCGVSAPDFCLAFGQSYIEARTWALIAPDFSLTRAMSWGFGALAVIGLLSLAIAAEPIHHEVESFFISIQN